MSSSRVARRFTGKSPRASRGASSTSTTPRASVPRTSTGWSSRKGRARKRSRGPARPGTYKWFVVYWGGFGGIARPTHWQVRVKHNGKVNVFHGKFSHFNERSKIYTLKVELRGPMSRSPDLARSGDRSICAPAWAQLDPTRLLSARLVSLFDATRSVGFALAFPPDSSCSTNLKPQV